MRGFVLPMLAVLVVILICVIVGKLTGYDTDFMAGWLGCMAFKAVQK